jgi:prepilin-type N-terminal cleavage/methylation domain-containing protein
LKTRETDGFTLVEVMIAMAIVALTAVVLMDQRIAIVRDAGRARDMRSAWVLASQKMAELELDKTLWTGLGSQSNGDFGDVSQDYTLFQWEYQILREPIDISDPTKPAEAKDDKKKRELYRLTLTVRTPAGEDPIVLEAEFSIDPPKPPGGDVSGDPSTSGTKDLQKLPDGSGTAVDPAGGKK